MIFNKMRKLSIDKSDISVQQVDGEDYLCLTDMIKAKDGDFFVTDWIRQRGTLDFMAAWESLNNPDFNYGEFAIIRNQSGVPSFKVSAKEWISRTGAIGIVSKAGRYGGTYAHKDIAFEFGMWISPMFKLYLIKEYQRLLDIENNQYNLEWNVKRVMTKVNHQVHTDAVKDHILPKLVWNKKWAYANEADLLNIALFGKMAAEWRKDNPERYKKGENIRDSASINELVILSNIESYSAELIKQGLSKEERLVLLRSMVETQKVSLSKLDPMRSIKKLQEDTYVRKEIQDKSESKRSEG